MKTQKAVTVLYVISTVLSYTSAVINFATEDSPLYGIIWLCTGSAFLCSTVLSLRKKNEKSEDSENSSADNNEKDK